MTVQPLFDLSSGEPHFLGSSLQLTESVLLTCDHVLRSDQERRASACVAIENLFVGLDRVPVARVISSEVEGDDLALLEMSRPVTFSPIPFSKQWMLKTAFGYGFDGPPFDRARPDGPITLPERSTSRQIAFDHGMPSGFSGGPCVGTFRGIDYCVGLNWLGMTGRVATVLIPAAHCVDFVNNSYPGVCRLVDLGVCDLLSFLRDQHGALEQYRRTGARWRISTVFSRHGARHTSSPLLDIAETNGIARKNLAHYASTTEIMVAIEGRAFGQYLRSASLHDDAWDTLRGFLSQQKSAGLTIFDALNRSFGAGTMQLVLLGDERKYLGTDYRAVHTAMELFVERSRCA
jgi:hypothetical protein